MTQHGAQPSPEINGGLEPIPKIGQHLLTDRDILSGIVDLVPKGAKCVEIGPGFGALTEGLINNGNQVIAYEIDERAEPALDALAAKGKLSVRWQNFLDVPNQDLKRLGEYHLVGNIPFHISEPLMTKLVDLQFESAVLLVGEKLAKTIQTKDPAHSDWSRLSLLSQAYFDVSQAAFVPRSAFDPPPRVDGAVMKIVRKEKGDLSWQTDPLVQSYRAIADANADNSTLAKALKGIMVDAAGRMELGDEDHVLGNRKKRRAGRVALKDYAAQYNYHGAMEEDETVRPAPSQNMYDIVRRSVDPTILSKPLSGVSNSDLRKVCSVISGAVNRRTKT